MRAVAISTFLLAAAAPPPGVPSLTLVLGQAQDREIARKAIDCWSRFQGPKEIVLAVHGFETLEADVLTWLDVVPRGVEITLGDPDRVRRCGVRRLPCFLLDDGRRIHRTFGVPKEVTPCSR